MPAEAQALIKINRLLDKAGWRFFDDETGPANIALESGARITQKQVDTFGEFRTRRLVQETWDRLRDVKVGNPEGYHEQVVPRETKRETISIFQSKSDTRPAAVQLQVSTPVKSTLPVPKVIDSSVDQPLLTDLGLYKCLVYGKTVMGFEKGEHAERIHSGGKIGFKKIK